MLAADELEVEEDDDDEHLHQLEDWDVGHRLLMVWNGDMEMTCGLRIVENDRLRLAGLLLLLLAGVVVDHRGEKHTRQRGRFRLFT